MRFRVLGPVTVDGPAGPVRIPGAKQLTVLALLLLHANRVVPVERLAAAMGGDERPATVAALQTCVFRLRRVLADAEPGDRARIATYPTGYELRVDEGELDLAVFRDLVARATAAPPTQAIGLLADALRLWAGPALDGLAGRQLAQHAAALAEERLATRELHARVRLALGQHAELIPELTELIADNPLRERPHGLLMLALHRAGRRADAVRAFDDAREILVEQLGIDPGPELQGLRQQILRDETAPAAPRAARNDLPGDITDFTGRDDELRRLLATLPRADADAGTAVLISAIDGMAGIGKTTLAVHAAHRLADRYPDAQLFIDLHAHTEGRAPTTPAAALDTLLRAVGVPGEKVPETLEARAALWRAELADRRAVIVLDNAATAAQVRPLLPGASGCLALVTSRRQLADLDAARTLSVDVLPHEDAVALFARVAGEEQVTREPDAVRELVLLCGYLPLAIRIAAARLRTRPAWTASHLAERLRAGQRRLAELASGDRSVAAAFALSYQDLTPAQQRLFRLLGLHPGPDVDRYAAAALTGRPLDEVEQLLEDLVDVHLIGQPVPGRYRFHDLLRQHAHSTARDTESDADRRAAVTRLLDYYLHTAHRADGHLVPALRRFEVELSDPPEHTPTFAGPSEALAWCGAEHANLVAAIFHAEETDRPRILCQLPIALWRYFLTRGYTHDWISTHQLALAAARRVGDPQTEARALQSLANVYWHAGRYDESIECHTGAALRYGQIGDHWGEALTLTMHARVCDQLGRYQEAVERHTRALTLFRLVGGRSGELLALTMLGSVCDQLGRFEEAFDHQSRALAIAEELGDQWSRSIALTYFGTLHSRTGRHEDALRCCAEAVALCRRFGDRRSEAVLLTNLGAANRLAGRPGQALDHQQQALALARQIGLHRVESRILNELGLVHRALGRLDLARADHEQALAAAARTRDPMQQARAHDGIAHAVRHTEPDVAREHWTLALAGFVELGVPEAAEVREVLGG
ncbi:tetratricopeptide repeat protein [Solihabitans fulvus]|nr:tetratricopeptide repeat protein [Solihabitans fulvus]